MEPMEQPDPPDLPAQRDRPVQRAQLEQPDPDRSGRRNWTLPVQRERSRSSRTHRSGWRNRCRRN